METFILSRVLLGALCLLNAFLCYCGFSGSVKKHINRFGYYLFYAFEFAAVTAYIGYDNMQSPPIDGWYVAFCGYLLVYVLMLMAWGALYSNTVLDVDKTYDMYVEPYTIAHFMGDDFIIGYVMEHKIKWNVWLPWKEFEALRISSQNIVISVKFKEVLNGNNIVVTIA